MKSNSALWVLLSAFVVYLPGAGHGESFHITNFNKGWEKYQHRLETADQLVLFSLNPDKFPRTEYPAKRKKTPEKANAPKTYFFGYEVFGQLNLSANTNRQRLLNSLEHGIKNPTSLAACFEPRHGLRAVNGTNCTEFVICFACRRIDVHEPGKDTEFTVSPAPAVDFNAVLTKAKIPLDHHQKSKIARTVSPRDFQKTEP